MKRFKYLFLLVLLLTVFVTNAQNKKYDWSIGTNGAIYSYSAILERKLTNPYEYRIGANFTVSRYLNNHFDLTLQGNRSSIDFPIAILNGEPVKYERTHLYGANFTLKYKLDNGYILKEHTMFAPYVMLGGGASLTTAVTDLTYITPVGLGVQVHVGERTSLIFESQYNHDFTGSLSYMQNNIGLRVHLGKANKKRVQATRKRDRERHYAKIRKYREEQRLAQAQQAKNRLDKLRSEGLVGNMMTMEDDADLLNTQTIVLNDEQKPVSTNIAPTKPKETVLSKEMNSTSVATNMVSPTSPSIPESPGKPAVEETKPLLNEKPPMPKPKQSSNTKIEENSPIIAADIPNTAPTKPKENAIEGMTKPKPIPSMPKEEVTGAVSSNTTLSKPQAIITKPEIKEEVEVSPIIDESVCRNREAELSSLGANINFDSDRYRIRSRMYDDLNEIVKILKECEGNSYVIIAHADSDGNYEYNRKLSKRRAIVIKKYLMYHGIDGSRLTVVAYSSSVPVAPNTSSNNKAKNRRIEFKLNRKSSSKGTGNK